MSLTRISLLAPLTAGALIFPLPPLSYAAGPAPAPMCGRTESPSDASWAPTSTTFGEAAGYDPYVGNGYLGHRVPATGAGYAATGEKTGWPLYTPRYDGAFVSGLHARDEALAEGREVIAALPSWTTLDVRVGSETYGSATPAGRVSRYRQTLHLRCGVVVTSLRWTTADGRATDLTYEVLADRSDVHTGAVRLRMTPHWSGTATVTGRLDGRGARRVTVAGDGTFRTLGTGTEGAIVQRGTDGARTTRVRAGRSYTFEKYVGVDTALTSRTPLVSAGAAADRAARRGWSGVLAANAAAWREAWASDVRTPGSPDLQAWLRAAQYGLLANTRPGSSDSIAPAGLTSDNYAGMVFWDAETWMYPGLLATRPDLARSVVEYRYRTRAAARANAEKLGHKGLFYPWTSASEGRLDSECQSWDPPHCLTQNHLQGDIALAVWQYYLATGDRAWLAGRGWPLLKGIADFWQSRATANDDGSYSVKNVAGPDEYSNGVTDGVFTNAVAATALRHATRAAALLGHPAPAGWTRVADGLRIPYDAERKLFLQYAGYNGSTIKQADTVLLVYPLEWPMEEGAAAATLDYYAARTDPDGPAMTDSVHAIDAAAIGEPGCATYTYLQRAVRPFVRGPYSLFSEARGREIRGRGPALGLPGRGLPHRQGRLPPGVHARPDRAQAARGRRTPGPAPAAAAPRGRGADGAALPGPYVRRRRRPPDDHGPADGGRALHRPHPGGAAPALRHPHAPHPAARPRPDDRRGPLPPGDGHVRGARPVRRGGGGRQPVDLLVTGRRDGHADGDPASGDPDRLADAPVDGHSPGLPHPGDLPGRPRVAPVPPGRSGPPGQAHGALGGRGEAGGGERTDRRHR